MPWREMSPVEQRADFVQEYESGLFTMTELAAQYGVSRKTGYKWLAAYAADGLTGLQDRSRRPHHSPARDRCGGGRGDPRHPSTPSALGTEEVAGGRPAPPPRGPVAGAIDGRRAAEAARPDHAAPASGRPGGGHGVGAWRDHAAQCGVDGRLQRRVSDRRSSVLLSVHAPRRLQSVCAAVRRA